MKATIKILFPIILLIACQSSFAGLESGVSSTIDYIQKVGFAIAGLFGGAGAVYMAWNPEGGSQKVSFALFSGAAIGFVPSLVLTIGEFFR